MMLRAVSFSLCAIVIVVSICSPETLAADVEKGYFWHVSDFHYDDTYDTTGQSCYSNVSDPGPFGNEICDAPLRLIEDSVRNMAAIKSDVDFILWTGDNAGHIPTPKFSLKRNLFMIQKTTSAINRMFPSTVVVPSFGNHDFFPADYTNGTENFLFDSVCKMWSTWIKDLEQVQNCKNAGFYSRLVGPKLRVMAVNTVLYLTENPLTKNMTNPGKQFDWLEATLTAARQAGEKVIMTGHVPPTIPTPSEFNWFYPQYQGRYVDLMTRFSDVIVAHHYGHEHSNTFKILQKEDKTGATPVFLAPSVTPMELYLGPGKQIHHNPGVRLVQYDRQTGRHLGYTQFYTNITEDNSQNKTVWKELYSFQDAYSVPDMTVASLRMIFHNMAQPNSKEMLQYCSFYGVSDLPGQLCSLDDKAAFWCGGQTSDVGKYKECIKHYLNCYSKKIDTGSTLLDTLLGHGDTNYSAKFVLKDKFSLNFKITST